MYGVLQQVLAGAAAALIGAAVSYAATKLIFWGLAPSRSRNVHYPPQTIDAYSRSKKLFFDNLTPVQRRQFEKEDCFYVQGSLGGLYCLENSYVGGIIYVGHKQRGPARKPRTYCLVAEHESIPFWDVLLARKIMLECDERRAIKTAFLLG